MGPPLIYLGEGGSGSEYSREILRCGHTGDTALRVIKLGGDPPHGTVPEGGGFHHQVVRRITGKIPNRHMDGGWEYSPITKALNEVGLGEL